MKMWKLMSAKISVAIHTVTINGRKYDKSTTEKYSQTTNIFS